MCGLNAECSVIMHRPMCKCLPGFAGDPFLGCHNGGGVGKVPVIGEILSIS